MTDEPHQTAWPDERLDDLNLMIREGFARTEQDIGQLASEIRGFRSEVNERLDRQNERFDSLYWLMIMGLFGIMAALIAGLIALA